MNLCEYAPCRTPTDVLKCETKPPSDSNLISYSFTACDGTVVLDQKYLTCPVKCQKCLTKPSVYGFCPNGYAKVGDCCIPTNIGGGGCESGSWEELACIQDCREWDGVACACKPFVHGECASPQAGCNCSPIVIDTLGDGFSLTDAVNGAPFDLNGDGAIVSKLAWTAAGSDDAWLALDRDGNGYIETGSELFGNFTAQPEMGNKNGFLALAEFDKPPNGGNSSGKVDSSDAVYSSLRLWQDANHNGVSEMGELFSLPALGVASIDLDYKESRKEDQYGNRFKYRAKVIGLNGQQGGKWAWDVFLRFHNLDTPANSSLVPNRRTFTVFRSSCVSRA